MKTKIELKNNEFKRLVSGYEKALKNEKKSKTYISENVNHIREFLFFMEELSVERIIEIDQALVNDYIHYLKNERLHQRKKIFLDEATVNKHICSIRGFWKYLNSEEVKVCAIKLRQKKAISKKTPTTLTEEEIEWFYSITDDSAIGYRDRAMLSLYYGCGIRRSEGHRICISDIEFTRSRIHIRKTKNSRERYVTMTSTVQRHIEEYIYSYRDFYLHEHSTYDELLIGERGQPITRETISKRIEALWNRVIERYGSEKQVSCHDLRHTLGTHLYIAGISIEMIALMLGHQTLEATQLYIHSANEIKKQYREQI